MKRICVFCGSSAGARPEYAVAARRLGRAVAGAKLGLVYGGAGIGLMNEVAAGALERGGEVIGVITRQLTGRELAHTGLSELRIVDTMHKRKALMSRLADGFIALPGGLGTLDELFEILSWAQLDLHRKPCGLLNVRGYYDRLWDFLHYAVQERFIKPEYLDMLLAETDADALLRKFAAYQPPREVRREEIRDEAEAETFSGE